MHYVIPTVTATSNIVRSPRATQRGTKPFVPLFFLDAEWKSNRALKSDFQIAQARKTGRRVGAILYTVKN
ncbi:hypothetical protein [Lysinibacter sp. HNR]|uniref:hypothetical protein n=1 Tax=Lysinibacter sp. HNR TaxID=3031408 RepID=UPI0024359269|nr:hypothetical protein [Lysinibacter sp. HNR]WGD36258.1 hypothetical protein FrondiHNR_07115 [Lysinibacter sp. HNR]